MRVAAADAIPLAPERLKDWLKAGYHGDMAWMDERTAERADPPDGRLEQDEGDEVDGLRGAGEDGGPHDLTGVHGCTSGGGPRSGARGGPRRRHPLYGRPPGNER